MARQRPVDPRPGMIAALLASTAASWQWDSETRAATSIVVSSLLFQQLKLSLLRVGLWMDELRAWAGVSG